MTSDLADLLGALEDLSKRSRRLRVQAAERAALACGRIAIADRRRASTWAAAQSALKEGRITYAHRLLRRVEPRAAGRLAAALRRGYSQVPTPKALRR